MMDSATLTCENKSAAPRWWNTREPLTHSLDCGKEQAVTQRTCSIDGCETTPMSNWPTSTAIGASKRHRLDARNRAAKTARLEALAMTDTNEIVRTR